MSDRDMNLLSRLAILAGYGNIGSRFKKCKSKVSGKYMYIADAIEIGDKSVDAARSLIEWGHKEAGMYR